MPIEATTVAAVRGLRDVWPLRWSHARSRSAMLFVGLVLLNVADLISTHMVLSRGGEEGNPVMEPLVSNMWTAVSVKALCLGLIGYLVLKSRRSDRMLLVLAVVDLWYAFVVLWNVRVLLAFD